MRKLLTIIGCVGFIFLLTAAIGDRFTINDFRIDGNGNWIGNVSMTGNKTLDGLEITSISSEVIIDTATELTVTDRYMIFNSTGTGEQMTSSADPFISTITYTQGTVVTIIVAEGTIILGENGSQAGSRLSLTSAALTLQARDNLTLRLRNDYWEEISQTNNQ